MKGDVIVVEAYHRRAAQKITEKLLPEIKMNSTRFSISIGGESGSGKSETAKALQDVLKQYQIKAIILGQDDYFVLPPRSNDAKRREDPQWLGPHVEVNLDLLEKNIIDAVDRAATIIKPLVDYTRNIITEERINLEDVKVIIVEGTYTSLLRTVDTRIFIDRTRVDTIDHRKKRNRGDEVGDPFIEGILKQEHKIIAGHKHLADIIITKDYDVCFR